jgi:two-component system KDP operon response regulator KdpE
MNVLVELLAWLRAKLRRREGNAAPGRPSRAVIGHWLLRRPGQLVGSAQLAAGVWGGGFQQRGNCVRFHLVQLRRKLEENPARPRHLLTEHSMGYRYLP